MIRLKSEFEILKSDDVSLEGLLASDVSSMWRRLAGTDAVRQVKGAALAGDRDRLCALASFVDSLLEEPFEPQYRHPNDVTICAALVVLEMSPLSVVRHLFARLDKEERPSLVWVKRMAQYCRARFVPSARMESSLPGSHAAGVVLWSELSANEPAMADEPIRFTLDAVA